MVEEFSRMSTGHQSIIITPLWDTLNNLMFT